MSDARIPFCLMLHGECTAVEASTYLPRLVEALRAQLALSPEMADIACVLHIREEALARINPEESEE